GVQVRPAGRRHPSADQRRSSAHLMGRGRTKVTRPRPVTSSIPSAGLADAADYTTPARLAELLSGPDGLVVTVAGGHHLFQGLGPVDRPGRITDKDHEAVLRHVVHRRTLDKKSHGTGKPGVGAGEMRAGV